MPFPHLDRLAVHSRALQTQTCICTLDASTRRRLSSLGGTIIRFNMHDDDQTAVMFDHPARDAASFDAVTNVWINGILVVDQSSIILYVDEAVEDSTFGFFDGAIQSTIPRVSGQRWMQSTDWRSNFVTSVFPNRNHHYGNRYLYWWEWI